jgi:hypothetical protein
VKRTGGILLVAVALLIGAAFLIARTEFGRAMLGHWSFTKSVEEDRGTYFRLRVQLAYKGEAQDFDIVVGCNVRQTNYKDGGRTVEVGLVPSLFGRRMPDGKGLVIRPPDACRGQTTANGEVQPDLLPIIVLYDSADTFEFGKAYLSEDAYDGPLSELKFGGASIEIAARADFERFRRELPNAITRESYHSRAGDDVLRQMGLARAERPFGHSCEAYVRFRIPEELRSVVRQHWPEGRPNYWLPDTHETQQRLANAILNSEELRSDEVDGPARPSRQWDLRDSRAASGLPTRSGGGLVRPSRGQLFPPAYYPSWNDLRTDAWPVDPSARMGVLLKRSNVAPTAVDFRGGRTKGFANCFSTIGYQDADLLKLFFERAVSRVDDTAIVTKRRPSQSESRIFERDEYLFLFVRIFLESTRGDV